MVSDSVLLDLIREESAERQTAERRFQTLIKLARSGGVAVADIADAAGLSVSRIHGITGGERLFVPIEPEEIARILQHAFDIVIVAAGWVAYPEYRLHHAYVCQAGRGFRQETERMGFYWHKAVMPEFARILHRRDHVSFTLDTVAELRGRHGAYDEEVAGLIEAMLTAGSRKPGDVLQVFLLTGPDDLTDPDGPGTYKIPDPIKHTAVGAGSGFVRKQRYTSQAALEKHPTTTDELLRYERE